MDIIEAIRERKSIRGYRSEPVPEKIIRKILDIATRAPSAENIQPWHITVVSGRALEGIRQGNLKMLDSGELISRRRLEGVYRSRQVELAIELFGLMGITREDRKMRDEWLKRGFRFFDAPAAIFISTDNELGESSSFFDCGALTQTICLAALSFGLGTCIVGQGVMFPEVVRSFTGIPASQRLVIGIALGYPDRDFPANKLRSKREPIDNTVSWCRDN